MEYAIAGTATSDSLARFSELLGSALERTGFVRTGDDARDASLVLNLVDLDAPKPFRRGSRGTYVVALFERDSHSDSLEAALRADYPQLVRALANITLCYVPGEGAWFTTMERGHYGDSAEQGDETLAAAVVERLLPLARSRLVIDN